ncbi:MAG TPA: hypothetical protein DDX19_01330 [Rhodopirellula baltica]|uniref:Uncharacterized protein n=1 Tax=Rhodopirellula baltica (strain DSM 10527 / NCIMB 13988 / SH1) TaxID=243090 RepID=Q7UHU4_RHOBA|nr:hypothetical protein RB12971 [Rhodopirellula baltica SH 1]HBE61420.1 hypothetical protein [Rhodopirellula baltica]
MTELAKTAHLPERRRSGLIRPTLGGDRSLNRSSLGRTCTHGKAIHSIGRSNVGRMKEALQRTSGSD